MANELLSSIIWNSPNKIPCLPSNIFDDNHTNISTHLGLPSRRNYFWCRCHNLVITRQSSPREIVNVGNVSLCGLWANNWMKSFIVNALRRQGWKLQCPKKKEKFVAVSSAEKAGLRACRAAILWHFNRQIFCELFKSDHIYFQIWNQQYAPPETMKEHMLIRCGRTSCI